MLVLETLKNILKPLKTQNNYITTRVRALAPSRGHALPVACCMLSFELSLGHTSFLEQHHFQGNIQQLLNTHTLSISLKGVFFFIFAYVD
jgi:hypothetical protein